MWRDAESGFPGEDQGCPTCSFLADGIGDPSHLHACDTTLALVSQAPIASIGRFRKPMGWQVRWCSSAGSDFNYDFYVSLDEGKLPLLRPRAAGIPWRCDPAELEQGGRPYHQ